MKSIVSKLTALICFLISTIPAIAGTVVMSDPFVSLVFDPAKPVHELVSQSDYPKFKLRDGPWWVFARYVDVQDNSREYLVLSGLTRDAIDTDPVTFGELAPDFGFICFIENGKVTKLGVADNIDQDFIGLPKRVSSGLLDDFVDRTIKGFGSKRHIEAEAEKWPRHPWILKMVAEAFERAGIHVPPECVMPPAENAPK